MDYYHHVRELKEEHARKMADAPITTKVERPTLNFDMAAFAAARDSKRAASQSASASSASSSLAAAAALRAPTKAARVTRDEANTAANGIISATMSDLEPDVASSRASRVPLSPAVAAETPTSHNATAATASGSSVALHGRHQPPQHQDMPTADFDLVQHYLYTLDTSVLDELGIKHRGVTRASIAALLCHHRLRLPASAPRDKDGRRNAAVALLARFLRVSRTKPTSLL
jgi:hypothetical protein